MEHIIDPTADWVFDAAVVDVTAKGVVETKPLTDDDWLKVERGGLLLAESMNLLKMHPLLEDIPLGPDGLHAYFVHSYQLKTAKRADSHAAIDE